MNDFPRFLKTLAVAALIALMALTLARKSDAGQFSTLIAVAIDVANSEAQSAATATVRSGPILPLVKERPRLVRNASQRTVCDDESCRVVSDPLADSTPAAAGCPCDCPDCTCPKAADRATTPAAPQASRAAPLLARQPARTAGKAVARGTGKAVRGLGKGVRAVAAAPIRAVRNRPGIIARKIFAPQRPRLLGRVFGRRCR